ncbi:hypothetical protein J32TS2_38780 [Shouchella clausii]|nr:hypothetical protein J32TS2_38780 [Shouchella clausii]
MGSNHKNLGRSRNASNNFDTTNGGFLWKVTNNKTVMYVFSTIHLGDDHFYPLDPIVEEAFNQADVIMPEINPKEESIDQAALMKLA